MPQLVPKKVLLLLVPAQLCMHPVALLVAELAILAAVELQVLPAQLAGPAEHLLAYLAHLAELQLHWRLLEPQLGSPETII